jgi:hypothetical protein
MIIADYPVKNFKGDRYLLFLLKLEGMVLSNLKSKFYAKV